MNKYLVTVTFLAITLMAEAANSQSQQLSPVTCSSKNGIEAIGTLYKSGGIQSGPGWLQLTVVANGKTYLDSEDVNWSEDAQGNLTVSSENVDNQGAPQMKLSPSGSYLTTKDGTKIAFAGCAD